MAVAAALLAGCGGADRADTADTAEAGSWPLANADARNTRRTGGPIDASSVSRLRVAWWFPVDFVTASPVVADGVVYVQDDQGSNLYALDLRDGRLRWRRTYDDPSVGPNGVGVADGRVYGATSTEAFARDARTGAALWSRKLVTNAHEGIDMAPGVHDGTVYISTVPANVRRSYGAGGRGVLWALDGATGRPRWSWATVPEDLWGRPDVNSGGGLWYPPAIGGEGDVYASVANPGPWPGTPRFPWGSSRPGPNRWTNSLVKLDAATGRLAWGRQVLPHDLYDWDLECPPILTRVNGRPIVVTAGKMGFVYAFDRVGGRLLWKRSVGVHNGHDDDSRRMMSGDGELHGPVRVLPGNIGGVETPMAVDDDTVYVPVENLAATYKGTADAVADPFERGFGEIVALDLASGRVKWRRKLSGHAWGGVAVVNDLVFTPSYEGTLWALRTSDGSVAWSSTLPAGVNAPVAIAGDTVLVAAGTPLTTVQTAQVIAFRLRD